MTPRKETEGLSLWKKAAKLTPSLERSWSWLVGLHGIWATLVAHVSSSGLRGRVGLGIALGQLQVGGERRPGLD